MDSVRALQVDAFTDEPLSGNAAGVVPDGDGLTEAQMQAIAREFSLSETAFLLPSGPADRKVRYFTPSQEVDLCGHATIAAHAHLHEDGVIEAGTHTLETNVGVLDIEVAEDGAVWMTQDDPTVRPVDVDYERLATVLGVPVGSLQDVGADMPSAVASTGLPFLVVPVNFLEHVGNADPDMAAVEELCEEYDATGLYAFTFDTLEGDATLHARMFAPGAGVSEDPVTGTASGAAGAYLREVSAFDGELPDEMVFEQGHFVDRPGRVRVRVGETVRVGGDAATAIDGTLSVPAADDDDILEA
ncbi:PhzF family phenazine biosynthesis protein [Halostella sp. PRR32]|uniref:PhzF family phenazine biosynthesis protein n=1 Tax=Halostella sp. PRR32 TaxID=3098147 RepID=UPI002B1E42D4|nr:PhzF family phenazine biosynthesis protein [Halostella sp. PRR32]